jgi:hypothetical protein
MKHLQRQVLAEEVSSIQGRSRYSEGTESGRNETLEGLRIWSARRSFALVLSWIRPELVAI